MITKDSSKVITIGNAAEKFFSIYHEKDIQEMSNAAKHNDAQSLQIDYNELITHLEGYNTEILIYIVNEKPEEVIKVFNKVLNDSCKTNNLTVRFKEIKPNLKIRNLGAQHIGKLISTNALIKNMSEIRPKIKNAVFECRSCMRIYKLEQKNDLIRDPALCHDCVGKSFSLILDDSEFINSRILKLEEPLELRTSGTTREFIASIDGDIADPMNNINPGDVVNIIGIVKPVRNEKDKKFKFILELNNIIPLVSSYQDLKITKEEEEAIKKIASDPNIFEKITNSIAPSINGHKEIKQGLALQQLGAYDEENSDKTIKRGSINILLVGDPGTGKSQLLSYVSKLAPKGIFTSGATSTGVGLTAAAVRDDSTGGWTIEAGTMVLADGGTACIDEMDKLKPESLLSLNEAMEQGTVSKSAAGIVQTMRARTSVLGAANPKYSRFDRYKSIKEQIQIPESNLSRYDLIFAIEDKINEDADRELADQILSGTKMDKIESIEHELFKRYIAYARESCQPVLTDAARDIIKGFYVKTRAAAEYDDDAKPITPRDLEAIKRLTIARARAELNDCADSDHANEVIEIYRYALNTLGLNPGTAGDIRGEKSKKERNCIRIAENLIKNSIRTYGDKLSVQATDKILEDIKVKCNIEIDKAQEIYDETWNNIPELLSK